MTAPDQEKKEDFFPQAIADGKVTIRRYYNGSGAHDYEFVWEEYPPLRLTASEVWSNAAFRRIVFERWALVIDKVGPTDWQKILQIIADTAEHVEEKGSSFEDEVKEQLSNFCSDAMNSWSTTDLLHHALLREDHYYFSSEGFESFFFQKAARYYYQRYRVERKKMFAVIKGCGGDLKTMRFRKSTKKVWCLQVGFDTPEEPGEYAPGDELTESLTGAVPDGDLDE